MSFVTDAHRVPAAVYAALGEEPVEVAPVQTGPHAGTYRVTLRDRTVLFKCDVAQSTHGYVVLEAWATREVSRHGVPTAPVLFVDDSRSSFPRPFAVFDMVDGTPLSELRVERATVERVLEQAGAALAKVHTIKLDGFGLLDDWAYRRTGVVAGTDTSWPGRIAASVDWSLPYLEAASVITRRGARRAREMIERYAPRLKEVERGVLLHGDLDPAHLIVRDGELVALVDFGDRQSGPPAWDLARLPLTEFGELGPLLAGYRTVQPDADPTELISLYRMIRALGAARYAHERQDDEAWQALIQVVTSAYADLGGISS